MYVRWFGGVTRVGESRVNVSTGHTIYRIFYRNRCLLLRGPGGSGTFSAGRAELALFTA